MKKLYKLSYILILFLAIGSCKKDNNIYSSDYVTPISLHLVYKELGVSIPYSFPPSVKLTNSTEQIVYKFTADEYGNVTLNELLPGQYSINVTAKLNKDEMAVATGDKNSNEGSLGGTLSNIKLSIDKEYSLDELTLMVSSSNPIIFKELYYAGSATPTGMNYRNDCFFTIYNNSIEDVSLKDYYIASMEFFGGFGAGPLWTGEQIGNYKNIYAAAVWKIVGDNENDILKSGEQAIIATMAAPHNKNKDFNLNSPVDLSNANYEAYCKDPQNNYTDFPAKNMELFFWPNYGYLWRISVFGQGMALIKATKEEMATMEQVTLPEAFQDPFENDEFWICLKVPNKYVVDAVDLLQNSTTTEAKRFSPILDAGAATVADTYKGKSVIRKVQSINGDLVIYQDSNNSTEDFIINPTPLKDIE